MSERHDPYQKLKEEIERWARQSQNLPRINAMITMAAALPDLRISADQVDQHPHLLTVRNGTIDLRTGTLREHRREDFITLLLDVDYHPDAKAPRWKRFVAEATDGDPEMASFLQLLAGYCLTGEVYDRRAFFLVVGPKGSGKTTFVEALRDVWGEYAATADVSTFLERDGSRISNDLARLRGKRLVAAGELPEEGRLAADLIKRITGKDTITARFLYQEFFEFRPVFKLLLSSNYVPHLSASDDAVWDRVSIVPFESVVPPERREPHLLEELLTEREGILAWAVQGAVRFYREGLQLPKAVIQKTQEVREEMDLVGQFLAEECVLAPCYSTRARDLYRRFRHWCTEEQGMPEHAIMKQNRFGRELTRHGLKRDNRHDRGRCYLGVALRPLE